MRGFRMIISIANVVPILHRFETAALGLLLLTGLLRGRTYFYVGQRARIGLVVEAALLHVAVNALV
jgi:hypothetical protein